MQFESIIVVLNDQVNLLRKAQAFNLSKKQETNINNY